MSERDDIIRGDLHAIIRQANHALAIVNGDASAERRPSITIVVKGIRESGNQDSSFTVTGEDWGKGEEDRHGRLHHVVRMGGPPVQVCFYLTTFQGGFKLRVAILNAMANRDGQCPALYFSEIRTTIDGRENVLVEKPSRGYHVLRPGGCFQRTVARDGNEFGGIDFPPAPSFTDARAEEYVSQSMPQVGPYVMSFTPAGNAPGGDGVGYYPDWCSTAWGMAAREKELLGVTDRQCPVRLNGDFTPNRIADYYKINVDVPFMLEGWGYVPTSDRVDPCTYSLQLCQWQQHDDEHIIRAARAAYAIATLTEDPFAKDWLRWLYNDLRIAWGMNGEFEFFDRVQYGHVYGWPLYYKVENTQPGGGAEWMGRDFAHVVRVALWTSEFWDDAIGDDLEEFSSAYLHCANTDGLVLVGHNPSTITGLPAHHDISNGNLSWPMAQGLSSLFNIDTQRALGERQSDRLVNLADAAARYIPPIPLTAFEVHRGQIGEQWGDEVVYHHLGSHGTYEHYENARGLLSAARSRPFAREQPLDWAPRDMWEDAV